MKRLLISVFVIAVISLSWLMYFKNIIANTIAYNSAMDKANNYYARKLYDPAIDNYKKALDKKDTRECRYKMLDAYKKRSLDAEIYGLNANEDYIKELESVVSKYKDDTKLALELSDAYIRDEDFESAYDILLDAKENGADDKSLNKRIYKLKFRNHLENVKITSFRPFYGGKSAVFNGVQWGIMKEDGSMSSGFDNKFENQPNSKGCVLIQKTKEIVLYDEDEKVLGRFGTKIDNASMYSENRVAIKTDGKYRVYDKTGKKKYGEYDLISTFKDGEAVVFNSNDNSVEQSEVDDQINAFIVAPEKLANGKWSVIDINGKKTKDLDFDRIVFDNGGYYMNSDVVVASKDGKYSLYDDDFKNIIDESYEEIGVPTSDKIYSFKKDNKWGFIDDDGDVIIKPEYEEAKSFSNGMAAVKKDGKWGFINKNNKMVIKNEYEDADYFNSDGACFVKCTDSFEESGTVWKLLKLEISPSGKEDNE